MPVHLPPELHLLIVESLATPPVDFRSSYRLPADAANHLRSTSLVSKRFNEYATRILYRRVAVGRRGIAKLRSTLCSSSPRAVRLASHIHSLLFEVNPEEGAPRRVTGGTKTPAVEETATMARDIAMVLHATAHTLRRLFLSDMDFIDPSRVVCFHHPYSLKVAIEELSRLEEFIAPRFKHGIAIWNINSSHLRVISLNSIKIEPTFILTLVSSLPVDRLILVNPMLPHGDLLLAPTIFVPTQNLSQLTLLLGRITRSADGQWVSLQPDMIKLTSEDTGDCVLCNQTQLSDVEWDILEQSPKHHVLQITK
ncbi:hypothetical protein FRC03_007917 [Tulasnella sp. 419]|nr:hypothetical protein FRC03_007917 [Tulasnella sp. 419]